MVISDQQIRHREQRRVHHSRRPAKHQNTQLISGHRHKRHSNGVKAQPAHIDFLRPVLLDETLNHQGVAGTGEGVHGHAPTAEPHALLISHLLIASRGSLGISPKHRFAHEIGKVQRVADVRHPAKEICQADHPQGARHKDNGPQIIPQGHGLSGGGVRFIKRGR